MSHATMRSVSNSFLAVGRGNAGGWVCATAIAQIVKSEPARTSGRRVTCSPSDGQTLGRGRGAPARHGSDNQIHCRIEAKTHGVHRQVVAARICPFDLRHPAAEPGAFLVRLAHHSHGMCLIGSLIKLLHPLGAPLLWRV